MRHLLAVILCSTMFACSTTTHVRNAKTYRGEVEVMRANYTEAAAFLSAYAQGLATTDSAQCRKIADLALVLQHRGPWHADMQLYLGGLSDKKPSSPPTVPASDTLCGGEK